ARLRVVRIDPILIRSLVGSLTIELRQLLPCGRSNPRFLRQPPEKLLIVLARLPSHNRTQGRVRLQGRGIDAHRLPLQQALFRQELQHPAEHRLMGFHVDQPSGAGDRRVVGRRLVQPRSQKTAQCQRVRTPTCAATLAADAFKIPDELQTEVPPRRQTRPPHPLRVEPGALLFHPFVKAALFQQSVQLFRKTDALPSAASLSVRSKSPLVVAASLFGPLPCAQSTAHCCGSLNYLRRESRLAPRAARRPASGSSRPLKFV